MSFDYKSEDQWLPFSDYYEAFLDSVRISSPISDFTNPLAEGQYMEFAAGDGPTGFDSCEAITTQAITRRPVSNSSPVARTNSADNGLLCLYVSSMQSLRHQEIVNPTIINDEQVAAAASYGPSVGIDYGDRAVYLNPKNTGREEIMDYDANYAVHHSPGDGSDMQLLLGKNHMAWGKRKKRKTDQSVSGSVFETNAPVTVQKFRDRGKSWPSSSAYKNHDESFNSKLDAIRPDPPELLYNIVKKDRKDYIHVTGRRGQATDRHRLAERIRRQKISYRMDILQNLVPACSKITNKALVLDEIIMYVQSLQNQVEILSMKMASTIPPL